MPEWVGYRIVDCRGIGGSVGRICGGRIFTIHRNVGV